MRVLFLFFILFNTLHAQSPISGIVKDSENNTPLAFSSIILSNGKTYISDIDGKFIIEERDNISFLYISYTGYQSKKINVLPNVKFYTVKLTTHTEILDEIVINSNNAANSIIRTAILRKNTNDPQKKLNSFQYKSYDRLIVTANPDSISSNLDSIFIYEKAGRRFKKIDSSDYKFKTLIEKQHLYQTEKVSEFKFNKQKGLKETVLALRMAGFKQPLYEFVGLKLQSHSVYNNRIDLLETKYISPIAENAMGEYNYKILDTVSIDNRNTYMIHFRAKGYNKKRKLEGVLYIDAINYGVAKVIFRVRNVLDITSTHYFKYEEQEKLWFPDKKSLKIVKGNNKENIKILGETIKFNAVEKNKDEEKEASDFIYLLSESENFDTQFNIPVTIKRPDVIIEIDKNAISRPEDYWNKLRKDTLDPRSIKTYTALDSLVQKENWEQRILFGKKVINGYAPISFFDLDLRHFIKYNNYEGFRLGIGGITNNKFAETFRISGYTAYGTKDGNFKYNIGGAVRLGNFSNTWIGGSYTDDVKEIASTSFSVDKRVFKIYDPRPINLTTFYNHKSWQSYVETRIIPKTESTWQLTRSLIEPKFFYQYTPNSKAYSNYIITTASAAVQWNPFSDYMQTPSGRLEVEKRFPKFTFQYTQSFSGILDSDFTFGKIDFRTEYENKFINGQKVSFLLQTGVTLGDVPLTHLYSTSPNNLDKDAIIGRITFAGKNSFETMYFNEFFSSQYLQFQIKHAIRKFTLLGRLKLSPVLVSRFAWGNMDNKENHIGLEYNTLEKGYLESGIEFNEIFKGLGLTAFYRYGPYHLPTFDRNISLKISYILNLGF